MKTLKNLTRIIFGISMGVFLVYSFVFAAGDVGTVSYVEGRVDVQRQNTTMAVPLREGELIFLKDVIRTKSNSKAEITFKDKSVLRLAQNSRAEITDYQLDEKNRRKEATVNLLRGKVRTIIAKMHGGADFNIFTPNTQGKIKGSDVFTFFQAGVSGMLVSSGTLSVANTAYPQDAVIVTPGNSVVVPEAETPKGPRPYLEMEKKFHEQDTNPPPETLRKRDLAVIRGVVTKISGVVKITAKGERIAHDAKLNEIVAAGDAIETGSNGKIELKFDNGNALNIKPDSKLVIVKLTADPKSNEYDNYFELSLGKVKATIEKLPQNSSFRVKTPTAISGVRGTIMYIDVTLLATKVFFEGGLGFITSLVSGETQEVGMGETAFANDQGMASVPVAVSDEERSNITEDWEPGSGIEGYSAPEGASGLYLYESGTDVQTIGDTDGGVAEETSDTVGGGDVAEDYSNQPQISETSPDILSSPSPSPEPQPEPEPPSYSFSGNMNGFFGRYHPEDYAVNLDQGAISGSFSGSGSESIWESSQPFSLTGTFTPSVSPDDNLWGGEFSGTTSDGASLLGYSLGAKGSLNGLLYAFYIRPDGLGGYRSGYIKSTDIVGNFYPEIGIFEADGVLTRYLDIPTNITPGQLYNGSPDIRTDTGALKVGGDITGLGADISEELNDQEWAIWQAGLGGTFAGQPSDNWHAVIGSASMVDDNTAGYGIVHITGQRWLNGILLGTMSGRDIWYEPDRNFQHDSLGTEEGSIAGTFEGNNWQAVSLGSADELPLQFGATVTGDFGKFDIDLGEMINSGSFTALLGGTNPLLLPGPSPATIMGEYTNPDGYVLWTDQEHFTGRTSDGAVFAGVMGGLNLDNALRSLALGFYIRADGAGGYRAGYLKSTDLAGSFYPEIGMFEADGTVQSYLDLPTIYTPEDLINDNGGIEGDDESTAGLISSQYFSGVLDVNSANIEDQDWGLWWGSSGGNYQSLPSGVWSADMGGATRDEDTDEIISYFLGTLTGDAWQNNKLSGAVNGTVLSDGSIASFSGDVLGTYDNAEFWQALMGGTYTDYEVPLYASGPLRSTLEHFGTSTPGHSGLIGLKDSLWDDGTAEFISIGELNSQDYDRFIWQGGKDTFYSYYADDQGGEHYTTFDRGDGLGSFFGVSGGTGGNNVLQGSVWALYIDPQGNAGVLSSDDLTGQYWEGLNMYRLDGTLTNMGKPTSTGWETAQYVGILPEDLHTNISWDNLTGSPDGGSFAGGEDTGPDVLGFSGTMLNIGQQNWGVWNFVTNGTYQGPTSDTWDVYDLTGMTTPGATSADTSFVGGSWLGGIGSDTTPGKWSGSEIEGPLDAIWIALRQDGTLSGRKVNGEVVGNYVEVSENQGTWQAASAGEWVEVTSVLDQNNLTDDIIAVGQAANVPITVAYSSLMTGADGGITSMAMDTHLYNMGPGGGDGIWAAIISGSYATAPTTDWSVTVQNGADNATLSGPAWSSGEWLATSVDGTVNGNTITGKAAGTYGDGDFIGAGTGTYEHE